MQELPILNSHLRALGMRENGNEGSSDNPQYDKRGHSMEEEESLTKMSGKCCY